MAQCNQMQTKWVSERNGLFPVGHSPNWPMGSRGEGTPKQRSHSGRIRLRCSS